MESQYEYREPKKTWMEIVIKVENLSLQKEQSNQAEIVTKSLSYSRIIILESLSSSLSFILILYHQCGAWREQKQHETANHVLFVSPKRETC